MQRSIIVVALLLVGLAACGDPAGSSNLHDLLALDGGGPVFVFFYVDG